MTKTGNDLVTKKYLDTRLYKFKKELRKEIGIDSKSLTEGFKDEVLSEIKKLREDDQAHKFSHSRMNDELQKLTKQVRIQTQ